MRLRLHVEKLIATATKLAVVSIDRERAFGIGTREFDDARGAVLKKHAVVRDEDDSPRAKIVAPAEQKLFHPAQTFDIEMVRRLVQEEEIRRAARGGECARERKALFPTARERFDGDIHACVVKADLSKDDRREDFRFVLIAVAIGTGERCVGGRGQRCRASREFIALRDVDSDRSARRADDAVVCEFAALHATRATRREHTQERRLSRAVRADHADAFAVSDRHRDPAEEFTQAVRLGKVGRG